MVTVHASLRGSWSREHWPPEEDQKWSDGNSAIREGGSGVAIKYDHTAMGRSGGPPVL